MVIESTATVRDLRALIHRRHAEYDGGATVRLQPVNGVGNDTVLDPLPPVGSQEEGLQLVCNLGTRVFQLTDSPAAPSRGGFRSARKSHLFPSATGLTAAAAGDALSSPPLERGGGSPGGGGSIVIGSRK
jgi:hypothetical protein